MQWLRLCASTAGGTCSIPGWGSKIPHATQRSPQNKTKLQNHYLLAQYLSITLGEKFQISIMMVKEHPCPLPSSSVQLATPLSYPPRLAGFSTIPCLVHSAKCFLFSLPGELLHILQDPAHRSPPPGSFPCSPGRVSPFPLPAV